MFSDIYNYFREKLNRCTVTDIAQNGDQKIFNFIVIELLKIYAFIVLFLKKKVYLLCKKYFCEKYFFCREWILEYKSV